MARLKLFGALAALLAFGESFAVALSTTGTGQVLIYPYYSARNLDTVISLTNETSQPKAVKVHIREAEAGLATLFFNVYLPAGDSWSGLISSDEQGRAFISANDRTCTVPYFFAQRDDSLQLGEPLVYLRTLNVASDAEAAERIREGFVEVIEIGELTAGGAFLTNVQACNTLVRAWIDGGFWEINPSLAMAPPTGGLSGEAQLVDPVEGISYRYQAVALQSFSDRHLNSFPGFEPPTLADASRGQTPFKVLGTVATADGAVDLLWDSGIEAVSGALATASVSAQVLLNETLSEQSEVVVTFPTRRFFTDSAIAPTGASVPLAPFDEPDLRVPYQLSLASGDVVTGCQENLVELPWTVQTLSPGTAGILDSRQTVPTGPAATLSGSLALAPGQSLRLGCDGGHQFRSARIAEGPDRGRFATLSGLPLVGVRLERRSGQSLTLSAGPVTLSPTGNAAPLKSETQLDVEP